MTTSPIPLRGPVPVAGRPTHILLKRALMVVHFSPVMKIAEPSGAGIAGFQDAVRAAYPIAEYEVEKALQLKFEDEEFSHTFQDISLWRFFDKARDWRVTLTRESISLETKTAYSGRVDFSARMSALLDAVHTHYHPAQTRRFGVRYLNTAPREMVLSVVADRAPALGAFASVDDLEQSELLWRFNVDEGDLILRAGVLPADATHDPAILEPVDDRTWFLDIDVVNSEASDFGRDSFRHLTDALVERAHAIFGWATGAEEAA